jgi:hypothetical protein
MSYFLALFVLISTVNISVYDNWILHSNEDIGYSFYGPDNFQQKSKIMDTGVGEVNYTSLFSANDSGDDAGFLFILSYYAMEMAESDVDTALLEIIAAGRETVNGIVQYQADIKVSGNPGKIWRMSLKNGTELMKGKAIYNGSHIFILQVFTSDSNALNPKVDAFLDSFRFHDPAPE